MPIYEYKCNKCGVFEAMQRIAEAPLRKCPTCKSKVERQMSRGSFILKGSGWYATDYAKKASPNSTDASESSGAPATNGNGASSSDSSAKESHDSKPAPETKSPSESKTSSDSKAASASQSSSEKPASAKATD